MPLHLYEVNIKARDDAALGRFRADALGTTAPGDVTADAAPDVTALRPSD